MQETPEPKTIRVLLADDQAMVLGALRALLDLEPDIEVVGAVQSGDQVLQAARGAEPDICLLDIEMPGLSGIEVTGLLARELPEVRCLILTTFGRPGYLQRALEAGAWGFMVKDTPATELAEAVRRVHRGERVVDPKLAVESVVRGASPLTAREADVLREALSGAGVETIAGRLYLSAGTVRNHISSAIAKTGTTTRVEAAIFANEAGWL